MNIVSGVITALEAGLSLWNNKEKTKYFDRLTQLKRDYYNEMAKPESSRSDAVTDNIEFELGLLVAGFASSIGIQIAPPQQG